MSLSDERILDDLGQGSAAELSLGDELRAAFEADTGAGDPAAAAAPAVAAAPAAEPARDDQGRFARAEAATNQPSEQKPPQAAVAPSAAPEGQQAPQDPQAASGPPPSWSAAAKAQWDGLPDAIRQEVGRHEATVQQAKAQWQQKGELLNRLTTVIGPRADRWRMAGFDLPQGIQRLVAAEDALERDPVNAIAHLARSYGVDLRMFAQAGQRQPQIQLPPQLQQLVSEVGTLKSELAQQREAAQGAHIQGLVDQVTAFAVKPENKYFANVQEDMYRIMKASEMAGNPVSIADAYERATWANPEVRALILRDQAEGQAAADRAKAAQARHASGSVTGSPSPGASPARAASNPNASVRDDLMAVFDAVAWPRPT
jgi:hypothetical protein